jgi:hypothetical protein
MTVQRLDSPTKPGWWLFLKVENGICIDPELIYVDYNGNSSRELYRFHGHYCTELPKREDCTYLGPLKLKDIKSARRHF